MSSPIGFYTDNKNRVRPISRRRRLKGAIRSQKYEPELSPTQSLDVFLKSPEAQAYAEKQAAKAERYKTLASKAKVEANQTHEKAQQMADVIPFGQPILTGHHSEKSDRSFRARIDKTYEKSFELSAKAEYYKKKAENTENPYAISSDDPEVVIKLKQKIEVLEKQREIVKGKTNEDIWKERGSPQSLQGWDFKRVELESLSRKVSDAKKRIQDVERTKSIPARNETIKGVNLVVDQQDNRVKLFFPSIPSEETRKKLKSYGFHWSPQNKAWQRQTSNAAVYYAEEVLKDLG